MSQEQSSTTRDLGGGPLRVLQINSSISRRSGVMSVLMNYLRHMDRSQVVFDFFCYATPDETHREEIEALGGRCYVIDAGNHIGRIRSSLGQVLEQHAGQYPVAHLHDPILSRFLYPVAHRHGVRSFAVHSHATAYSDSRLRSLRNWLVCRNIGAYSDARLACSRAAGDFLFGSGRFEVVPNAIDVETYRFNESVRAEVRSRLGHPSSAMWDGSVSRRTTGSSLMCAPSCSVRAPRPVSCSSATARYGRASRPWWPSAA